MASLLFYILGLSFRDTRAQSLYVNRNIRMLCFVKKVLKRIKDVDRLWRLWGSSGPRIIFLESLAKNYDYCQNYDAEMNNSAVGKIKNLIRRTQF